MHGAGDGRDLGVPLYVPYRIGLCRKLRRNGWTWEQLRDLVDWEESTVTDMVEGDLPKRTVTVFSFSESSESGL